MKICLYTGSALPKLGGQEAVVDALAREFLRQGHEPTVLAPRPRLPLIPYDAGMPYPVIRHPRFFSTKHFVGWYKTFLMRAARRNRFDIIHCHDVYPTGFVASLCRAALRIPLVITSHGGDVRAGNLRLEKPGMRPRFLRAVQTADTLISIGQFTSTGFAQLQADPAKIRVIPNGVDLLPFARRAARPVDLDPAIVAGNYFLFMGRLSHRKGVDVLLGALAKTPPAEGVELVIAGGGEERSAIEARVASLQLSTRIRLVGRVTGEKKVYLLQNALAVVVPSRGWEAFPLVVLEAYAAGRPVIGSRIAGLQEVVSDRETGLLIEPESETEWATALQKARADTGWAWQAGENARQRASGYGWDQIAARHLELYRTLVKSAGPILP